MEKLKMLLNLFFLPGALAQCSQSPNLVITTPQNVEALSGSCLLIPCGFTTTPGVATFESSRPTFGVWSKNQPSFSDTTYVVYDSSKSVNKYPMNITGNLGQNICTTLMFDVNASYTDMFYFRILNGPFFATATCNPVNIRVNDSAPGPRIQVPANLTEKDSVTIICSAFTPCPHSPPKLTWSLQADPHNHMEENPDGTFTTRIQENFTLSERHDGSIISCSATYPVDQGEDKTAETSVTLSVSYAPKDTSASISPSCSVSAGSCVNLTCSSRAKPPVSSFTWFQTSTDGAKTVSEGAFYRLNATQGGVYYCVASNGVGNQTSPEIIIPSDSSSQLEPVFGVIIGMIVLICLILCIWCLKSTHEQAQSQTAEESKKEEFENIHYGEIAFINLRPEASSRSVKDSGEDTVYAHVKVSNTANRPEPATDGPEDVFTQVKK